MNLCIQLVAMFILVDFNRQDNRTIIPVPVKYNDKFAM